MIKIKIISVGKTKELWLEQALKEYLQRLKSQVAFEFCWHKDDTALEAALTRLNGEKAIALDPKGQLMSSEEFTEFFDRQVIESGCKLSFIIGGPEGLTPALKKGFPLISLS